MKLGDENPLGVTGARIKNTKTGETHEVEADGVFIAIGQRPQPNYSPRSWKPKRAAISSRMTIPPPLPYGRLCRGRCDR